MHFNLRIFVLGGALLFAASCSVEKISAAAETSGQAPAALQIWGEADPDEGPAPLTSKMSCDILTRGAVEPQFEWDFGDGSKGKGKSLAHTFSKVGKYEVRVKVTDKNGRSGDDTLQVEVTKPEAAKE